MGNPGKFEGCESQEIGEALYEMLNLSLEIDYFGETEYGGFYALISAGDNAPFDKPYYITREDERGFFDYRAFDDRETAKAEFDTLKVDFYQSYSDDEPEPEHDDTLATDIESDLYDMRW